MKNLITLLFNQRFRQIFSLFIRFTMQFWWLGKRKRTLRSEVADERYREMYEKQAQEFTAMAIALQGLLIKLGQFFSSRVDILPKEYTDHLTTLQDSVVPVATDKIIRQIEQELQAPIATIFPTFSEISVAAASLGQVHEAKLASGERVAVKVLRPGIEEIIAIDLKTLKVILSFAKHFKIFSDAIDLDAVYEEFLETINDELDYRKEARNSEKFREYFADDKYIYVPNIYWQYSTKKILVMEYIEGVKISDYQAFGNQELASHLATTIFTAYLKQILVHGFFHADPHPGNLLIKEDGTLVFIDFGMMGYVTEEMKAAMVSLALAVLQKDATAIVEAFDRLGFLRPHADRSIVTKSVVLMLNEFMGSGDKKTHGFNMDEFAFELRELIYAQPFQIPAKTTFLGKAIMTLFGICMGLDENFDIIKVSTPYITNLFPGQQSDKKATNFIWEQAKNTVMDIISLPQKVNRVIDNLESGELRFNLSKSFENKMIDQQVYLAKRIITAVLAAGVAIAGAILYVGDAQQFGSILFVISGLLSISLLFRRRRANSIKHMDPFNTPGFKKPKFHP